MQMKEKFDHNYWKERHKERGEKLSSVGHKAFSDKANFYVYKILAEQYEKVLNKLDLPVGKRFFDAGAGIGIFTEYLLNKGYQVDACDISADALKLLKEKNDKANIICCPLFCLSNDKEYDVVHCFDVLYHILDDEEWNKTLETFSHISREYIILHERFLNIKPLFISKHIHFRSYKTTKDKLNDLGFIEILSVPTHVIALQILFYKFSGVFPELFYWIDKTTINIIEKVSFNFADKIGSHHIKIFKRMK
jgi:SAM-dependent methyltransferase